MKTYNFLYRMPSLSKNRLWIKFFPVLLMLFALVAAVTCFPTESRASAYVVDTLTDENDGDCGDGDCSLRDALQIADIGDSIDLSEIAGTIILELGELSVSTDLTITGPTTGSLTIRGNNASRVFNIESGTTVSISNLTISNGAATSGFGDDGGGGILNAGTLTLNKMTVSGNTSSAGGGGICNFGDLTVKQSTISGNTASGMGGGIENPFAYSLTIESSTISGNTAGSGGGISDLGFLTVTNSTISGNSASWGGGLFSGDDLGWFELNNVTIYNNTAGDGSAINTIDAWGSIENSIVAGGCSFSNQQNNSTPTSFGNNIETDTTCGLDGPGDLQDTDPLLYPLADNGGPTFTHALLPGSPAIDAGNNATAEGTDQRGVNRPQDGDNDGTAVSDIGAFEHTPVPGTLQFSAPTYSAAENAGFITVIVTRVGGADGAASVDYATSDGTALEGIDYTEASGTLNWTDGEIASKSFTVTITDDNEMEFDETLTITLSNFNGALTGSPYSATLTIIDVSPGTLQFSAPRYSVNEDDGSITVIVTRVGGSDGAASVDYATSDGTALEGIDYTEASGTLNWTDGEIASKSFTVTITDDNEMEFDETLTITLSNFNGALTGSPYSATLTIIDVSPGTLQFSAPTYSAAENAGSVTVIVTRTGGSDGTASVDYATSDGTATAEIDYTGASGTLNWTDGETAPKTFTINITEDSEMEPDEILTITLSNFTGAAKGSPDSATLTIIDFSPGTLQFSASEYSAAENAGSVTVIVTRTGGSDGAASVNYATSNGTATAGNDYTGASGTLNWSDGETAPKTITVNITEDSEMEPDETLTITLSNFTGAAKGSPDSATLTIIDFSPGTLQFSASTYNAAENAGSVTVIVTRTGGSDGAASVDYATSDGTATAGNDYTGASGTLNWTHGETAPKTITVNITEDSEMEPDETLTITLSNFTVAAKGAPDSATLTIIDFSPGTLQFSAPTYNAAENAGSVTVIVTRTGGSDGAASVDYATSDGTATAGNDYTGASGTLNWTDGETASKSFTVNITEDSEMEPDETLTITLSNFTGAAKGAPDSATLTIIDFSPGTLQFSASEYSAAENAGSVTVIVTRTGGSDGAASVGYATSNGTATAGNDYTGASGTLNWTDGETVSKSFTVNITEDSEMESDETLTITLSNFTGAAKGSPDSATLTIIDFSPGTLQFSASEYSAAENAGSVTVIVTRTGGSDGAASVDYATSDGTATAGNDYTGASGTLNWTDGEIASKSFTVTITDDNEMEFDETLTITLSNFTGAAKGSPDSATLTIHQLVTHVVDTLIDEIDEVCDDGDCSLRDALQIAKNGDSIDLSAISGTIPLDPLLGELKLSTDLTIIGPTAGSVTISGDNASRVFNIAEGKTVSISNLTISNGWEDSSGGGILNAGDLTLNKVTLSGNTTIDGYGGGISNTGILTVTNSTISSNTTVGKGGGIDNSGSFTLNNVTLYNNTANEEGNAINSNTSGSIRNSILGGGCSGTPHTSYGNNIETDTTCGLDGSGDLQDTDPLLDPLADNGGPTLTHALQPGSPAMEAGNNATAEGTDQRSKPRPQDGDNDGTDVSDIGAFEHIPAPGTLQFEAPTYSANENAGSVTVIVTRTGGSDGEASVDYATSDGTALEGIDYTEASGTLNWTHGETASKTLTVTITDDGQVESNETLTITLGNLTGALTGATSSATLTIINDDYYPAPPPPGNLQFSASTYSADEDAGSVTVIVTRTGGSFGAASVDYATSDKTATLADNDYTEASGTLNWEHGETAPKTLTVTITEDSEPESDETLTITLSNFTGATAGTTSSATLTIIDIPPPGTLQFSALTYKAVEGAGSFTVIVTRTGGADGAASVDYATSDKTATLADNDYTAASGTLNWSDGETASKSFTVNITEDSEPESDEILTITLSNFTGALTGTTSSATLIIEDNDIPAGGPTIPEKIIEITEDLENVDLKPGQPPTEVQEEAVNDIVEDTMELLDLVIDKMATLPPSVVVDALKVVDDMADITAKLSKLGGDTNSMAFAEAIGLVDDVVEGMLTGSEFPTEQQLTDIVLISESVLEDLSWIIDPSTIDEGRRLVEEMAGLVDAGLSAGLAADETNVDAVKRMLDNISDVVAAIKKDTTITGNTGLLDDAGKTIGRAITRMIETGNANDISGEVTTQLQEESSQIIGRILHNINGNAIPFSDSEGEDNGTATTRLVSGSDSPDAVAPDKTKKLMEEVGELVSLFLSENIPLDKNVMESIGDLTRGATDAVIDVLKEELNIPVGNTLSRDREALDLALRQYPRLLDALLEASSVDLTSVLRTPEIEGMPRFIDPNKNVFSEGPITTPLDLLETVLKEEFPDMTSEVDPYVITVTITGRQRSDTSKYCVNISNMSMAFPELPNGKHPRFNGSVTAAIDGLVVKVVSAACNYLSACDFYNGMVITHGDFLVDENSSWSCSLKDDTIVSGVFDWNVKGVSQTATGDTDVALKGSPDDPEDYTVVITYPDKTTQDMPPCIYLYDTFENVLHSLDFYPHMERSNGIITIEEKPDTIRRFKADYFVQPWGPESESDYDYYLNNQHPAGSGYAWRTGDFNGDGQTDFELFSDKGKQYIFGLRPEP